MPVALLPHRLKIAIQEAGGTRRAAQMTGISEAQLYRYYAGTPVPSDKLAVLAAACRVRVGWLFGEDDMSKVAGLSPTGSEEDADPTAT